MPRREPKSSVFAIAAAAGGRQRAFCGPCALRWQGRAGQPDSHTLSRRRLPFYQKPATLFPHLIASKQPWLPRTGSSSKPTSSDAAIRLGPISTLATCLLPNTLYSPVSSLVSNAPTTCPACVVAFPTTHLRSAASFNSPCLFHPLHPVLSTAPPSTQPNSPTALASFTRSRSPPSPTLAPQPYLARSPPTALRRRQPQAPADITQLHRASHSALRSPSPALLRTATPLGLRMVASVTI